MANIYQEITDIVGKTPLLKLQRYMDANACKADILAKLEYQNPGGSVKDRVAIRMIDEAEKAGILHKGDVIIEPTSGNTGIGLACVAAARGYHLIITMPETMSVERRRLLSAYGAELVLTPASKRCERVRSARQMNWQNSCTLLFRASSAIPITQNLTTKQPARKLWADTDGKIDVFVAGVGTGGTISGTGRYLKEKNPNIQIVAVEPAGSPVLSDGIPGRHKIQGIGAGFIPETLDMEIYDEILTVTDDDAYQACRELARREGVLCGISSGAALSAAKELAVKPAYQGKTIVALFPDGGERYLSSGVFDE